MAIFHALKEDSKTIIYLLKKVLCPFSQEVEVTDIQIRGPDLEI